MSGGGGTTTNVTETGLGDEQYANLSRGQEYIRDDISNIGAGAEEESRRVSNQIRGLDRGVADLSRDQEAGFQNVNRNISGQTQQLTGELNNVNRQVSGLDDSIGGVQQSVTEGFGNVNNQFSDVGNQLTGLTNDVGQGFSNAQDTVRTGFSDLNTSMGDQFSTAAQERMQGFSGLSDQVGSGFAGQSEFLNQLSSNVLGGQQNLQDTLGQTGNRLDTYYGDLAERQGAIQQQVGGVQSGLTDFTQDYEDDTRMANQTRADLQNSVINQTNRIRNDVGRAQNQTNEQQSRLMDAVGGVDERVEDSTQQTQQRFQLASDEREQQGGDFTTRINRVRDLLAETGDNLDQQTRRQYADMVTSFDLQGNLIENTVSEQGLQISRALDQQGNLMVNRFDRTGNPIARNMYNVPEMLEQADMFSQSMQQQVPTSGLAGTNLPFTQTR
jgi:gas vesicle protein